MHPLAGDFSNLKDSEIESKITDLTKKYFMTHNTDLRYQMSLILEDYKTELSKRRQAALEKLMNNGDKSLDKLININ